MDLRLYSRVIWRFRIVVGLGLLLASTVMDSRNLNPLPCIDLSGFATTPAGAVALANAGAKALDDYIVGQQQANGIPKSRRVVAQVVSLARSATVSTARKKTTPVVV